MVGSIFSSDSWNNVTFIAGEIKNPQKNIGLSLFFGTLIVTLIYVTANLMYLNVLPLQQIQESKFVISEFIQSLAGSTAAKMATVLILWVAFASVFSATLGYSRIPYAAAADGAFFKMFAKLHPTKHFPHVSLLFLGAVAFIFSLLFKLKDVIDAILAMRILIQFIGQAIGLMLLMKQKGKKHFAWVMPLFPLPAIVAILMWAYIFFSTGTKMMLGGLLVIALGLIAFVFKKIIEKKQDINTTITVDQDLTA
jgi:amino acid transporter